MDIDPDLWRTPPSLCNINVEHCEPVYSVVGSEINHTDVLCSFYINNYNKCCTGFNKQNSYQLGNGSP